MVRRENLCYPDIAFQGKFCCPWIHTDLAWISFFRRYGIGGTSASCPEVAAIFGLINSARKRVGKGPVGWFNPTWVVSQMILKIWKSLFRSTISEIQQKAQQTDFKQPGSYFVSDSISPPSLSTMWPKAGLTAVTKTTSWDSQQSHSMTLWLDWELQNSMLFELLSVLERAHLNSGLPIRLYLTFGLRLLFSTFARFFLVQKKSCHL